MRIIFTALFLVLSASAVIASDIDSAQNSATNSDWVLAATLIRPAIAKNTLDIPTLKLAAKIYLELEIVDTGLVYAKRVYEDDDDEKENVMLYSEALRDNSRAAEATILLRKYLKKKRDVDVSLELVNSLVDADSLGAAELIATTARDNYPKSAAAYLALGNIYFNSKPLPVFDLAVQNYNEAIDLDSTLVTAHFNLAISYWRMANRESDQELGNMLFTRSLKEWNTVATLDPKNARAWYEQGKIFYLAGRYNSSSKALITYRELRPLGTGEIMASWYLGESLYKQNLCDSAKRHLEDAAARVDSLKPKVSLIMARCNFQSKVWKTTADFYNAALPIKATWENSDFWYYGAALVLSGDTTQAIGVMTEAAERDPKSCTSMFRFALLLQDKRMYARSNEIFRKRQANCLDSLNAKIHVFIGNNFFADSLVDSAIASYENSLEVNPAYVYATFRLGETYLVKGDVARGLAMLESVIANAQITAKADERNYGVGAIIRLNGLDMTDKKWQNIVDRSKIAKDINPKSVGAWLYLAIGYQGLQDAENAKKAYKEVLKLDPNNEAAKKNLKALGS